MTEENAKDLILAGRLAERRDLHNKVGTLTYLHRRTDDTFWVRRDDVLALLDGPVDG